MQSGQIDRRFRSAAKYYLSGRPAYASLLIHRVVELCALNATDRALSFSSTSPERLGGKASVLANEIRGMLTAYATDGAVTEIVESTASIARRNPDCSPRSRHERSRLIS
jgi:hypothetical protein